MEMMPEKTADELEAECLRLLKLRPETSEIERVGIVATHPPGTGPNWTYGEIYPPVTELGMQTVKEIVAYIAGNWALKY